MGCTQKGGKSKRCRCGKKSCNCKGSCRCKKGCRCSGCGRRTRKRRS